MIQARKLNQNGFHLILVIIVLFVAGALAAVAFSVYSKNKETGSSSKEIRWSFDNTKNEWFVSQGKAPACKDPYVFDYSPVDMSKATSVLFSGTYRGKSYKVHGGFGLNESTEVRLPANATLSGLTRYYEGNPVELQYKVDFETDCGIAFYFDHIHTLSPELATLAAKLPEPKINDTRVNPNDSPPRINMKANDLVATQTGAHKAQRYGIDFGVVDYRQRNEISKNAEWAKLHSEYKATEWYGVCWHEMLPGAEAKKADELSRLQVDTRRTAKHVSDYCENADHITLDFNQGRPVDYY